MTGADWPAADFFRVRLAACGALGGGSAKVRARNPTEPIMTTIEARTSTSAKRSAPTAPTKFVKTKSGAKSRLVPAENRTASRDEQHPERVTKHDRVLELLSQRNGASIPEIMEATGWQQHSVRGFLAGTVKKKLGFTLTSSKSEAELRRYKIDTKRGR